MSYFEEQSYEHARQIFASDNHFDKPSFQQVVETMDRILSHVADKRVTFKPTTNAGETLKQVAALKVFAEDLNSGFISNWYEQYQVEQKFSKPEELERYKQTPIRPAEMKPEFFVAVDELQKDPEKYVQMYEQIVQALDGQVADFIVGSRSMSGNPKDLLAWYPKQFQESLDKAKEFISKNQASYDLLKENAKSDIALYHKALEQGYDPLLVAVGRGNDPFKAMEIAKQQAKDALAKQARDAERAENKKAEEEQKITEQQAAHDRATEANRKLEAAAKAERDKPENMLAELKEKGILRLPIPPQIEERGGEAVKELQQARDNLALEILRQASDGHIHLIHEQEKNAVDGKVNNLASLYARIYEGSYAIDAFDHGSEAATKTVNRDLEVIGNACNRVLKDHGFGQPFKINKGQSR